MLSCVAHLREIGEGVALEPKMKPMDDAAQVRGIGGIGAEELVNHPMVEGEVEKVHKQQLVHVQLPLVVFPHKEGSSVGLSERRCGKRGAASAGSSERREQGVDRQGFEPIGYLASFHSPGTWRSRALSRDATHSNVALPLTPRR